MRSYYRTAKKSIDRVQLVMWVVVFFALAIVVRLFFLQVVNFSFYTALAEGQQVMTTIDPATRGKIYMQADMTGASTVLATNVPLDLLFIDPNPYNTKDLDGLIDTDFAAETIAPLLYAHFCEVEVYASQGKKTCEEKIVEFTKTGLVKKDDVETKDGVVTKESTKSLDDLKKDIVETLKEKMREKEVVFVPLLYSQNQAQIDMMKEKFPFPGIVYGTGIVYANPKEVVRDGQGEVLDQYSPLLEALGVSKKDFSQKTTRRLSRYVMIVRKMHPELSKKLVELKEMEMLCPQFFIKSDKTKKPLDANHPICQRIRKSPTGKPIRNFFGIGLRQENWRYYPEDNLAAQVTGFLNFDKNGSYGVEEEYDTLLRGNDGELTFTSDPMGRLIASNVKTDLLKPKEDGVDIYLTINRVVQKFAEDALARKVKAVRANGGQVVVMDPYTGKIIALAQYPNFNPNVYSEAYEMEKTASDPGQGIPMFIKDETGALKAIPEHDRGSISRSVDRYIFKNKVGPGAFYNSAVQGTYEPGSIFKPLIIASGIDSGEITPQTTYVDRGELKVDEFTIRNVSEKCKGTHNMVNVLNWSCNIGMSFVARKMGKALMYDYIVRFGFDNKTDIEFPDEAKGKVFPYQEWSDARLYNASFGQGLTVTPIQMAQGYAVLANGGVLVAPRVVDKIVYPSGKVLTSERQVVKRVISKETADTITAMLTSVAEVGGSKPARVPGYYIAGKTGTAQIASSRGGYEEGVGSTIGSFTGYLPANKPRFVIFTKIERPRTTQWADQTAAPLFQEMATFLMDHYSIPPERKK